MTFSSHIPNDFFEDPESGIALRPSRVIAPQYPIELHKLTEAEKESFLSAKPVELDFLKGSMDSSISNNTYQTYNEVGGLLQLLVESIREQISAKLFLHSYVAIRILDNIIYPKVHQPHIDGTSAYANIIISDENEPTYYFSHAESIGDGKELLHTPALDAIKTQMSPFTAMLHNATTLHQGSTNKIFHSKRIGGENAKRRRFLALRIGIDNRYLTPNTDNTSSINWQK